MKAAAFSVIPKTKPNICPIIYASGVRQGLPWVASLWNADERRVADIGEVNLYAVRLMKWRQHIN